MTIIKGTAAFERLGDWSPTFKTLPMYRMGGALAPSRGSSMRGVD